MTYLGGWGLKVNLRINADLRLIFHYCSFKVLGEHVVLFGSLSGLIQLCGSAQL